MVTASELAQGMVVRVEGQVYRLLEVEAKAAAAKLGGVVKAELSNLSTRGALWEVRFRPQETSGRTARRTAEHVISFPRRQYLHLHGPQHVRTGRGSG